MIGDTDQHCSRCGIYGSVEEIDPATSRCRDEDGCALRSLEDPEFA